MAKDIIDKKIERIMVGTWVQRTRLHLSEIFDFLQDLKSDLDLDTAKLKQLHKQIIIKPDSLKIVIANMDFILFSTEDNINCKIFEDGLITITKDNIDLPEDLKKIKDFYLNRFTPALIYLFSLGAPLPQELTKFEITFPYFIDAKNITDKEVLKIFELFKEDRYYDIKTDSIDIFRGDKVYVLNNKNCALELIEKYIEEQIFMREYTNLLHNYLNLHRHLWEQIDELRRVKKLRGSDVGKYITLLDNYSKSVALTEQRIHQMPLYLSTRESLALGDKEFSEKFSLLLSYKYRTLSANHNYIIGIWGITKNYISQCQSSLNDINSKITNNSINNLTIITATGVAGTIIGLFTREMPKIKPDNIYYLVVLFMVGYSAQRILKLVAKRRKYDISGDEIKQIDFTKFNKL